MEEQKKIIVVPAFSGAGASFISGCLASYYAEEEKRSPVSMRLGGLFGPAVQKSTAGVTLVEPWGEYFFNALGMEESAADGTFASYCAAMEKGDPLRSVKNMKEGVNWLVRVPGKDDALTLQKLFRLFSSSPGRTVIFDCSSFAGDVVWDLAAEGDARVLVIDPQPVKLIQCWSFVSRFLVMFPDTVLIANKMNGGVRKNQLTEYLGGRQTSYVSHIPPELMYRSQFSCTVPWSLGECRKILYGEIGAAAKVISEKL